MAAPRTHRPILELTHGRSGALTAVLLLGIAAIGAFLVVQRRPDPPAAAPEQSGELAWPVPGGSDRVTVEVLNGAGRDRLAAGVARLLRSRGIDVVGTGNMTSTESTTVLVRRGDTRAGRRVAEILGARVVREAPDSLLQLDLTVILGSDFAVALPFHP